MLPPRQRVKSCPTCRGEVEHLPTPVYVIKDLVHAIAAKLTLDGGAAPMEPEPEGPEPWKGIFEAGEVRRRGMRDHEDGVDRCGERPSSALFRIYEHPLTWFCLFSLCCAVECGHEILDGSCTNCGANYLEHDDSDGEFEADDLVGFLYGNGDDIGEPGPQFEFQEDDDDHEESDLDPDLRSDFDEDDRLTDDGFLVGDDEVEPSGSETEDGSEFEGDELVSGGSLFPPPHSISRASESDI